MEQRQYTGTLKFMHPCGYGFPVADNGENHFVHARDLISSSINLDLLEDGKTRFEYRLISDEKNQKLKAVDLVVL